MTVLVFGSINMDLVARSQRLPLPGETLIGHAFTTAPGGKGANQAVACARLATPTKMIGRVGGDQFGTELLNNLQANGVDVSGVAVDPEQTSGIAQIALDDAGENSIIVIPGANGAVAEPELVRLAAAVEQVSILLLQLELPLPLVAEAARLAHENGVMVILDPAPAVPLPADLYPFIDILTPNETEAATLVGFPIEDEQEAHRACDLLQARGANKVILKLGARGVFVSALGARPAFRVTAVDTVAAGDAFNGALAAALNQGLQFEEAVEWGLAAGALAVTQPGAQSAMPSHEQLLSFLNKNR